jgi:hypothetical protein
LRGEPVLISTWRTTSRRFGSKTPPGPQTLPLLQTPASEEYDKSERRRRRSIFAEEEISPVRDDQLPLLQVVAPVFSPRVLPDSLPEAKMQRIRVTLPSDSLHRSRLMPLKLGLSSPSGRVFMSDILAATDSEARRTFKDRRKEMVYVSPVQAITQRSVMPREFLPYEQRDNCNDVNSSLRGDSFSLELREHLQAIYK